VSHHRVTAYTVYPTGYDEATFRDKYMYALMVEERGENAWAVKGMFEVLNSSGEWEREPSPSGRDDDFLARCRFTEEEALRLAAEAVDTIKVMSRTIAEADAEVKIRTAQQARKDAEWRAANEVQKTETTEDES
jgi:hypothetical protein